MDFVGGEIVFLCAKLAIDLPVLIISANFSHGV